MQLNQVKLQQTTFYLTPYFMLPNLQNKVIAGSNSEANNPEIFLAVLSGVFNIECFHIRYENDKIFLTLKVFG